jgi:hypothetical protein
VTTTVTVTNDLDYKLLIDFIGLPQTNTVLEKVLNRANQYGQIFRTFSKIPDFTNFSEILPVSFFPGFKILSV